MKARQKNKALFRWPKDKTGQDIQDGIFKKMSADRKLEISSRMWLFAKELAGIDRILYGAD